ncbi:MAG: type II toxin-antitoxin system RelE/ParE family toxin [Prosthecobacter sp.]|jgi:toxin ParE1/3/4|uniref:type II toxin-antitoxin system RelE/ParE family toxin n=1 Tax=Prosthecobacter sp. TaxID=1965333 RepID=UPI0019F6B77D|nr:type II toxin-antitoxin system RelE/ParE family toxin [Prosthecobacter sp.]MBE2283841.1 type II toxin-antitoxin system RelE/ParE family toxin [Prosthecobacter sp.]
MKVVYSEHFQAELCCVTGRYSAEDKELGRRFVQTVEHACVEITADPLRCRVLEGRVRRCLVRRFPYIIYYLVEDDLLYFGALLHSARHPETYRAAFADL